MTIFFPNLFSSLVKWVCVCVWGGGHSAESTPNVLGSSKMSAHYGPSLARSTQNVLSHRRETRGLMISRQEPRAKTKQKEDPGNLHLTPKTLSLC